MWYKIITIDSIYCLCCSVTQSCLTLGDPMDCSTPGFPVLHQLPELAQTHVHSVGDAPNHLILCCPRLLLPSVFPSIRVFNYIEVRCPAVIPTAGSRGIWIFSCSSGPSDRV